MGAKKNDQEKPKTHLVPFEFISAIAQVLGFGLKKYGAWNWALGMDWDRPYSALQRHMGAWWAGEDKDPETGLSHLWHAGCNIMFLIIYEMKGIGKDTRYTFKKK